MDLKEIQGPALSLSQFWLATQYLAPMIEAFLTGIVPLVEIVNSLCKDPAASWILSPRKIFVDFHS